jgi:SAM-dependent methyltransferase
MDRDTRAAVRDYYGRVLGGSDSLATDACCDASAVPAHARPLLANIHEEVTRRYYGCGTVLPEALEGARVLDLGCGTGRDVYLLAQLVGRGGMVAGVDMTPEQLAVARGTLEWHRARLGADCPEISFHDGLIEELEALPVPPASLDAVVSNCVINLSPDKPAVFAGARRLLKQGGELHFADVYADRRVPEALRADPVLHGECLAGALYWRDFLEAARQAGFAAPRVLGARPLAVTDPTIRARLGEIRFFSATCRLFRLDERPGAEDHGRRARYLGGVAGAEEALRLDADTVLPAGEWVPVSGETHAILAASRLSGAVELDPGDGVHRGPFGAAPRLFPKGAFGDGAGCCG